MSEEKQPQLVRAIGRWSLAALILNLIIGSGIFGLPGEIAKYLGPSAPWAYLIAAAGMGVIMACFGEVASQFTAAGGPYLYAREAFGRFAGIQIGWMAWLVRITSAAANANLFVNYFGHFWSQATQTVPRAMLLCLLLGILAGVNVRGVRGGALLSNFFAAAKLLSLCVFVGAGVLLLGLGHSAASHEFSGEWLPAILALVFAYGGFEAGLMPMAEVKDPRRDAPFALFAALAACTAVYTLTHIVVMWALPDPTISERPLAAAAEVFLGTAGASLISIAALLSTYGHLSAQMVGTPRLTFAFAEQGDFPAAFEIVHPRFRTPYISILVFTALVCGLAIYGSFKWNAILSAVARLFTYGPACAALITLRRRRPGADAFRLPGGIVLATLGMAFCVLLIAQMDAQHLRIIITVAAVGVVNWMLVRRKR